MTNQIRNQKDQLAKLMATEDLTIVHKKVPTAYFDMKNRILCCPIFKDDLSNELYDLFMGHEVGHALYTPYEGVHSAITKNRTLKGYLNVVEDVRIEKAIRVKYAGLRKSFFSAYNELMEMDFFGIKDKNLSELSLIDKINIVTKVGARVTIPFTKVEQEYLDMANACETWDEVVECATAIYEYSKENETRTEEDEALVPQTMPMEEGDEEGSEDGDMGEDDSDEDESDQFSDDYDDSEDGDEDSLPEIKDYTDGNAHDQEQEQDDIDDESESEEKKTTGKEGGEGKGSDYDEEDGARESITEHNAHNNEDQFISEDNQIRTLINVKKSFEKSKNFANKVVGYKQMIEDWDKGLWNYTTSYRTQAEVDMMKNRAVKSSKNLIEKNKKLVAHMAKEFEMKQTALRSSKAISGKTGKLDMNKLAKYQIVDDVFKKVTMLPDGKNHGVTVMLDWSGSISRQVCDLLEQTLILVQFCKKVNIPHRIYIFTDSYARLDDYRRSDSSHLIELFSDKMSTKDYITNCTNVGSLYNNYFEGQANYRHFEKFITKWNAWFDGVEELETGRWVSFETGANPSGYRLGGTPLDACLVSLRVLLPKFNAEYQIEKSILTIITDGYSHQSEIFDKDSEEQADEDAQNTSGDYYSRIKKTRQFQDPFSKKLYTYSEGTGYGRNYFQATTNILDWIAKECSVVVTGYFVMEKKNDLWSLASELNDVSIDVDTVWKQVRKEGYMIKTHGYGKLFLTASSALSVDGDDTLSDEMIGAKKSSLMAAFKRNQRSKTTSRFLTNEFIKEIA